jgi:nicotinate-nucleotide adenylyltransferase
VLGGAFNPPHAGHLLLAREAISQLELDRVMLVPTGRAPHKVIEDDPGAPVRLRMAELAAESEDGLEASAIEIEREGLSYMYETLEQLAAADAERELTLLMGADVAASLPNWKKPERIVALAWLGIAGRDGVEPGAIEEALESLDASGRAEMIGMPRCEVSSTMVRERAATGKSLEGLVPPKVAEMILAEGLYRGADR